jgi:ribose-phosphate pyrophosphokinase
MKLIAANSNRRLSEAISRRLATSVAKADIRTFQDGEVFVEIQENVRGEDVFVIQSTSYPANDHLMELLITIDALTRASASRITAVIPYFGYARQDRKAGPRTPISAKLVANLITTAGADRVLTVDLHTGQIQGFFDIPTDNLYAVKEFEKRVRDIHNGKLSDVTIVSPDVGGVGRARALAKRLNDRPLAIVDKRREGPGKSEVMNIIGDVSDRHCLIFDDIVDSGGTLCNAAQALMDKGAKSVSACITHGVLSDNAAARIMKADALTRLIITDSIEAPEDVASCPKIEQVTIATLLAEAIRRIANEESVSSLFD